MGDERVASHVADLLPAIRTLRELGANVVRISARGDVLVSFVQLAALDETVVDAPAQAEEDDELVYASADG